MQNSKTAFSIVLSTLISIFAVSPATSYADNSNNGPMSLAILGAIGSLGLACYQGTAPCVLRPHINTNKLTASADMGSDNKLQHTRFSIGADWTEKVYEAEKIDVSTMAKRVAHVKQTTFGGKRIVIFSGGAAKGTDSVLDDARAIQAGGGEGSIIGRNAFQRPKPEALELLNNLVEIYKGK